MKPLLLLLLSSFASATGTQLQTQDLGASSIDFSGTNTHSGAETFTGTTNLEVFLSSRSFSAVSAFSLGVSAAANSSVRCGITFTQNTAAGYPQITFNSDTTNGHYAYSGAGQTSGGVTNNPSNSAAFIAAAISNQTLDATTLYHSDFAYINNTTAKTLLTGTGANLSTNFHAFFFAGSWANAALPTTMTVTASAGTMTGFARCTYTQY